MHFPIYDFIYKIKISDDLNGHPECKSRNLQEQCRHEVVSYKCLNTFLSRGKVSLLSHLLKEGRYTGGTQSGKNTSGERQSQGQNVYEKG